MPCRLPISAAAVATALGGPQLAIAQPPAETMRVQVGDLDLSSPAGGRAALRRVQRQTAVFCGEADIKDLRRSQLARDCRNGMEAKAVFALEAAQAAALSAAASRLTLAER